MSEKKSDEMKILKYSKEFFEMCKKNINSKKKRKYILNEQMLNRGLRKKFLLELKYHELSNIIGWIQITIILASTSITFVQGAEEMLLTIKSYLPSIISVILSTYIGLILSISRFFKLDEQKEEIVNLLGTYALYINKLKSRKNLITNHSYDYYKRDVDYEYHNWDKLEETFDKDGSDELKVHIDNEIDLLLTQKDKLKYQEKMLKLKLQEYIIEQQEDILDKVEPLHIKKLFNYKTEYGICNWICCRVFNTKKFYNRARENYMDEEMCLYENQQIKERNRNELESVNHRIDYLKNKYKVYNKDMEKIMGEDRLRYTNLINEQEKLMVFNMNNSNNNEKFSGRQTMEIINSSVNNNIKIETELGIRDYPTYTIDDYNNKMTAIKNYDFVHNNTRQRLLDKKSIDIERHVDNSNFYYPDTYYGIMPNGTNYEYDINSDDDYQNSDDENKITKSSCKDIKLFNRNINYFDEISFKTEVVGQWKRFVSNYKRLKLKQIILKMKDDEIECGKIEYDDGDIDGDENV